MVSDESLIKSFLARDEAAFDALYDRYAKIIWQYAYNHSSYKDESFLDDIRDATLIAVFTGLKQSGFKSEGPGSFRAWVFTVCLNTCLAENRRIKREGEHLSDRFPEELPDDLKDDQALEPSEEAIQEEESTPNLYLEAMKKLSEEDGKLLVLMQDLTLSEIAKIPPFDKLKPATLRQRTCRIRRFLVELHQKKETIHGGEL